MDLTAALSLAEVAQSPVPEQGFFFEVFGERIRLLVFRQENGARTRCRATC